MPNEEPVIIDGLTPKEKRVAPLLIRGMTRKEIARVMNIAESTVKTHTENIFRKADVKTQKALMTKYLTKDDYGDNWQKETR